MRQYRRFPAGRPAPEPPALPAASTTQATRQTRSRLYARFKPAVYILIGILIMAAGIYIYSLLNPVPRSLTQKDIDRAVERSLETAKPRPSFASMAYEVIRPSIVRINAVISKPGGKRGDSIGSGIVVNQRGMIVTCYHVVRDAEEIKVLFSDGTESPARVIDEEPENDLALLQPSIIPDDLVPATLTASASLRVGDEVFAVGHPFGINNSVSAGVVSGLNRTFRAINGGQILRNLVQFDAAVNPGNSGGPLVNRDGEVVGIVAGLLNPNDDEVFVGIGFAIPIEAAASAMGESPF